MNPSPGVYGTLRPPQAATATEDSRYFPAIAEHILTQRPASFVGADLYDLGAYPAAVPGEGTLHGDLLQIEPAALSITDRIEGHPTFFRRTRVTVQAGDDYVDAWVYWAPAGLTAGKTRVHGGDWFQRRQS